MDYLNWELERQRGALRALLGGGNGAALREEARRETAGRDGGGPAGESVRSGGTGGELPAAWEPVHRVWSDWPEGKNPVPAPQASGRALLPGGERDAAERRDWAGPEGRGPETLRAPLRERGGPPRFPFKARSGETADRETAYKEPMNPAERAGEERSGAVPAGGSGAGTAAGAHAAGTRPARRLPVWAPEPGEVSGGAAFREDGGSSAARAEEGARALSRAVQRDARRYDGGFTIYG